MVDSGYSVWQVGIKARVSGMLDMGAAGCGRLSIVAAVVFFWACMVRHEMNEERRKRETKRSGERNEEKSERRKEKKRKEKWKKEKTTKLPE